MLSRVGKSEEEYQADAFQEVRVGPGDQNRNNKTGEHDMQCSLCDNISLLQGPSPIHNQEKGVRKHLIGIIRRNQTRGRLR